MGIINKKIVQLFLTNGHYTVCLATLSLFCLGGKIVDYFLDSIEIIKSTTLFILYRPETANCPVQRNALTKLKFLISASIHFNVVPICRYVILRWFMGVILLQEPQPSLNVSAGFGLAVPTLLPRAIPEHWTILREGEPVDHQQTFLRSTRDPVD